MFCPFSVGRWIVCHSSRYGVWLTLSLVSSNIPLLYSVLPVTFFQCIVLIVCAIFLSFNIGISVQQHEVGWCRMPIFHLGFTHSLTLWRLPKTVISILRGYFLKYTHWSNKESFSLMIFVTNILVRITSNGWNEVTTTTCDFPWVSNKIYSFVSKNDKICNSWCWRIENDLNQVFLSNIFWLWRFIVMAIP